MRQIGAPLGRQAEPDQRSVNLAVERRQRVVLRDPGPERIDPAFMVERADSRQGDRNRRRMDLAERECDILGERAIDLTDIADSEMELLVILPAGAGHAAHRRGEQGADRWRRTQCDEQAVHVASLSPPP